MCLCGMCMRRVPKVKVSLPIYPHVGSIPTLLTIHSSIQSYLMRFSTQKKKKPTPLPSIENMTEERKKRQSGLFEGDFFAPCSFFPTRRYMYLLCQPYLPYLHWVHTWLCWCCCWCCWCCCWSWSFSFSYIRYLL